MTRPHQPDQAVFRWILPEDINWQPFPAFPPSVRLAIEAEGQRLHALVPSTGAVPAEGETVTLSFPREALHLMEAEG